MNLKVSFAHKGDFNKTEQFFNKILKRDYLSVLNKYGQEGVDALAHATPVDTGRTADSWGYEIVENGSNVTLQFTNSNVNQNVNIAIILQYGHGTGTGGYVSGRDYINPAIQPIFDKIADEAWKEIERL